jgi:hypothetical protein
VERGNYRQLNALITPLLRFPAALAIEFITASGGWRTGAAPAGAGPKKSRLESCCNALSLRRS